MYMACWWLMGARGTCWWLMGVKWSGVRII